MKINIIIAALILLAVPSLNAQSKYALSIGYSDNVSHHNEKGSPSGGMELIYEISPNTSITAGMQYLGFEYNPVSIFTAGGRLYSEPIGSVKAFGDLNTSLNVIRDKSEFGLGLGFGFDIDTGKYLGFLIEAQMDFILNATTVKQSDKFAAIKWGMYLKL